MSDSRPSSPVTSANRRSGDRHIACTMAALERPDGEQRPALVHDLSESGALLLVRTTKIVLGDDVVVHLLSVDHGSASRTAQGSVVRIEEVAAGDSGPWLRRVAVRFSEPVPMHDADIEAFRQRAQRLGLSF